MDDLLRRALSAKLDRSEILWESRPEPNFPAISLTGDECALNCDYCEGRYLEGMMSVGNPQELYEICISLDSNGAHGVLLSGGYNEDGHVPFEPFLDTISDIDAETGLFVSVHSGLVSDGLAQELGSAGIDLVDFDFITDDATIRSRLEMEKTATDYKRSLNLVVREIPHVAPHILLGLSGKNLLAEREALTALSDVEISALVFLVIIPPDFSPEEYSVPSPEEVGKFVARARLDFPEIPLALGCMRPRNEERKVLETKAIEAGIDRIVLPSKEALKAAREKGLKIRKLEACCSVPDSVIWKWSHD